MRKSARSCSLVSAALLALVTTIGFVQPAGADDATASTNDASVRVATGWWWYHGVTPAQISTDLNAHHARLTQLKIEDPAADTFSVVMVANSGPYASGWWWYYGQTAAQVSTTLLTNSARLISISPYEVSGTLYFAVIEVPETGSQARGWEWFYGDTANDVITQLNAGSWRPIALEPYAYNGGTRYATIFVANTGYDLKGWYVNIGQPIATINGEVAQGYRVTSFQVDPAGGYDAILVTGEGEAWWFWYGQQPANISTNLANHHTRLIDLDTYVVSNTRYWTSVELDNTDSAQAPVNAGSKSVDGYAAANGWGAGIHGEFLAKVTPTGLAAPTVAANSTFRFEPASAIKILYATYAMRQVQLKKLSLRSTITYYRDPFDPSNPGVCPSTSWVMPANAVKISLVAALQQMLQVSDNRITRAFAVKFGVNTVNAWAKSIGLKSTHIGQPFIGCGFDGAVRNDFTLANAGLVYAGIWNGHLVTGAPRADLLSYLLGGTPSASSEWGKIVTKEAALAGKSMDVSAFLAAMQTRDKGGSYAICQVSCASYHIDLTDAGLVVIPFKARGRITKVGYAYGGFVNDMNVGCAPGAKCPAENGAWNMLGTVGGQDAASTILAALKTW
jgi:hypothetical protein